MYNIKGGEQKQSFKNNYVFKKNILGFFFFPHLFHWTQLFLPSLFWPIYQPMALEFTTSSTTTDMQLRFGRLRTTFVFGETPSWYSVCREIHTQTDTITLTSIIQETAQRGLWGNGCRSGEKKDVEEMINILGFFF